ncbi:MAG TPA: extracellular solute-binding protein [Candidatus Hydrogenedentes bacterium]|nr:extracellular solute-binding protein [Candidatus Hydrogenedentota bacterium]HQM50521.1 extracellular solute-binding protein [Candidatus Hydrogenedentota bacterium]
MRKTAAFLSFIGFVTAAICASASETVTLYYWGEELDNFAGGVVHGFEAFHDGSDGKPRIKVVMGQSASINKTDDPQRLLCSITGGDPPDVVFFDRFAVGEWAARGAFMSLQEFYEEDLRERPDDPSTLREEDFYRPCWLEACYEGKLYAVPTRTDSRALFYNKDLLEKYSDELIAAGCVDPEDPTRVGPPRTWQQLKDATRIMTERDASGKLVSVGFVPNYGNSWLYIYGWLNGGEFMSEDGRTCTLNSPEVVEALAYMTELYDLMGGAKEVTAFQSSQEGTDLDPFLRGKIAMRIDCDEYIGQIINLKRDLNFGVTLAPAPEGKQRLGWCGGWSLVIPRGAKHPREAWEFMKYMVSQRAVKIKCDEQRQFARGSGNIFLPQIQARKSVAEWANEYYIYSDPEVPERFKTAKQVFVEALPYSKCRPVTAVGQVLWNAQVRAMEAGIYKTFDPADIRRNAKMALDYQTEIVQRELDRLFHPKAYPEISWTPVLVVYGVVILALFGGVFWYFERGLRSTGYFRREYYAGYAFATPWFIGFLVFWGGPIVFSLIMSFCEYDVFSPPKFVGLNNYLNMFTAEPLFFKSLWNTLYIALSVPLSMAVGLGIAMLLSYEVKGMAVYRTFFYLPAIMPAVAAAILWQWIFNPQEGILNAFLGFLGLDGPAWLQDQMWSKPAIILMLLWGAGGGMIVWLAGLKGIPRHLYEAAEIDGAGKFTKFFSITLPMLSPYILFNLVMGLISMFQIFTQAYVMTQGGPVNSTLFYVYELFNNAFRYMRMGYAAALAWVLFAIILVLTIVQLRLSRKWVYYESDK